MHFVLSGGAALERRTAAGPWPALRGCDRFASARFRSDESIQRRFAGPDGNYRVKIWWRDASASLRATQGICHRRMKPSAWRLRMGFACKQGRANFFLECAKNRYTWSRWAKNRYILKRSKKRTPRACFWPMRKLNTFLFFCAWTAVPGSKYQYEASKILMGNSFWVLVWFIHTWVLWLFRWWHSLTIIQHYEYYAAVYSYIRRA